MTAKAKDYVPLLGLVMAAVIGVSLLCGVAVVGISDINNAIPLGTQTEGLVDFVISNMNTMIVETVQAFAQPDTFSLISPTNTASLVPTATSTNLTGLPPLTFLGPTKTLTPQPNRPGNRTNTPTLRPTATSTVRPSITPSNTPKPPPTITSTNSPTITDTPVPTTVVPTTAVPTTVTVPTTPVTPYP